jgi:hypothetical protein
MAIVNGNSLANSLTGVVDLAPGLDLDDVISGFDGNDSILG